MLHTASENAVEILGPLKLHTKGCKVTTSDMAFGISSIKGSIGLICMNNCCVLYALALKNAFVSYSPAGANMACFLHVPITLQG